MAHQVVTKLYENFNLEYNMIKWQRLFMHEMKEKIDTYQ